MENDKTISFTGTKVNLDIHDTLNYVKSTLEERGYDYKNQITGYIITGDPSYIPRYNNARNLIKNIDRNLLIEEMLTFYMDKHE
jgi:uncharacterized protein (UPF0297 family)